MGSLHQLGRRACNSLSAAKLLIDAAFTNGTLTGAPLAAQRALIQAQGVAVRWTDDNLSGLALATSSGGSSRVRVNAPGHGLAATDTVTVFGLRGTTEGNVAANAVTIVDADNFELNGTTYANALLGGAVTSIARNNVGEIRVTDAAHGLSTGDLVKLTGGVFWLYPSTSFNGAVFQVQVIDANTFDLLGSQFPAGYVSGAMWSIVGQFYATGRLPTTSAGHQLAAGSSLMFTGNLRRLAFIEETAGATINATFYK